MTNETKAKIIKGLSDYSGAFGKSYVVSITGPSKDFVPMELITNPEWAKGVWGPTISTKYKDEPIKVRVGFVLKTVELVTLHLLGKDNEVWERLKERWEEIKDGKQET